MMNFVDTYRCTLCGRTVLPHEAEGTCPSCGEKGILDVEYDYAKLRGFLDRSWLERNPLRTMFRYIPLLPLEDPSVSKMLPIGWTPLIRMDALERTLGLRSLHVKDEGANPSGSLKDRASAIAVLRAISEGKKTVACSSTGNAASSLACHAARMGLEAVIFVPGRAPVGKLNQIMIHGAEVVMVDGDYKAAYALSKDAIETFGWYNRNAAVNANLVEGKKTAAYEIIEMLGFEVPDWVVVSVGDGCTIAGLHKGFYDFMKLGIIDRLPRLLGVQSKGCAPLAEAFRTGKLKEAKEDTIADSIAVGIPRNPVKALSAVSSSKGTWVTVDDEAILDAMRTLGKHGIFAEPASAAGYAGLEEARRQNIIKEGESVVFVHTGHGLKDPENARRAVGTPEPVKADMSALKHRFKTKGE
jgi:threonine synthase